MDKRRPFIRDEIKQIEIAKGDGKEYLQRLEDEYNNMTDEEKAEVDAIGRELDELLGMDDDE